MLFGLSRGPVLADCKVMQQRHLSQLFAVSAPRWRNAVCRLSIVALVAMMAGDGEAVAQTPYRPTSAIDAYGNPSPIDESRRAIGIYQSEQQKHILTSYLDQGRRVNRRGGPQPFAFPSDARKRMSDRLGLVSFLQSAQRGARSYQRNSFDQYGGFGRRHVPGEPGSGTTALRRRSALISATGINAPVLRAHRNSISGLGAGGADRGVASGGVRRPTPAGEVVADGEAPPLGDYLSSWSLTAGQRARAHAWGLFRDGKYRPAARAFAQARSVDRDDYESRIGEWWCHVSVGALRTASVLVREWVGRDENPFRHPLNMREAFGSGSRAFDIRIEMRLLSSRSGTTDDLKATYALVLWYLGDVEEARVVTQGLARETSVRMYMDWPEKMRRALERRDAT